MSDINILSRTQRIVVSPTDEVPVVSKTQKIIVNSSGKVSVISKTQKIIIQVSRGVAVINSGPQGPPGAQGDPGPQGEQGEQGPGAGIQPFHFEQPDPESEWIIDHNRDTMEYAITVRDSDGKIMIVYHSSVNPNRVVLSFPAPYSGSADLVF